MQMTKAFGAYLRMPAPTCSMTLRLMPIRSSRLMPGLLRHAGGDDADIGALDAGIVVDADEARIETFDRRGLGDVEPLALRNALGDVEQHDVAEILEADKVGERAADHAGADEGYLVACHERIFSL